MSDDELENLRFGGHDPAKVYAGYYEAINEINRHDWTIYAYMRSLDYNWFIGSKPTLIYRQHLYPREFPRQFHQNSLLQ